MGMLFSNEIRNNIECLLFVASEPLSLDKLTEITGAERETVTVLILELEELYRGRGFQLKEVAGGWQFATRPDSVGIIEKYYRPKVNLLSKAALETLAIIAYRQPITRAEVEEIRGVKIDGVLGTLLEKKIGARCRQKKRSGKAHVIWDNGTVFEFFWPKIIGRTAPAWHSNARMTNQ